MIAFVLLCIVIIAILVVFGIALYHGDVEEGSASITLPLKGKIELKFKKKSDKREVSAIDRPKEQDVSSGK